MPTYAWQRRFMDEYMQLSSQDKTAFRRAKDRFVVALKEGRPLDVGLGIHQMSSHPGIYEFRFSASGRATFSYGTDARGADASVIWRRIGGHEIYRNP